MPDYNNYFPQSQVVEQINTKEECLKVGGQWSEGSSYMQPSSVNTAPVKIAGYCNPDFTKQQEYNNAQSAYQRTLFIILVVLGIISFILGAFIPNEIITLSLSWGGVLSLIIASMRYWSSADNLIKVLILGLALAALIWLALKKFDNN